MAIRTYDILLDSYNSTMPEPIVGRQGDKNGAVTLHVTITDRGSAVNLSGQAVNLIAETAQGTAVVADNAGVTLTDAVNGKFDYAIPNALWSESGKIKKAYFSLNASDGQQTTYDLIFIVKKAIDVSQKTADDYITIIDGTLRSLKEKIDAVIVPETFTNLDAIKSKYPNGKNGVMVAADNGHKYIWDGRSWEDAGVYQAVGLAPNSVTTTVLADKSVNFDKINPSAYADYYRVNFKSVGDQKLINLVYRLSKPTVSAPKTIEVGFSVVTQSNNVDYLRAQINGSNGVNHTLESIAVGGKAGTLTYLKGTTDNVGDLTGSTIMTRVGVVEQSMAMSYLSSEPSVYLDGVKQEVQLVGLMNFNGIDATVDKSKTGLLSTPQQVDGRLKNLKIASNQLDPYLVTKWDYFQHVEKATGVNNSAQLWLVGDISKIDLTGKEITHTMDVYSKSGNFKGLSSAIFVSNSVNDVSAGGSGNLSYAPEYDVYDGHQAWRKVLANDGTFNNNKFIHVLLRANLNDINTVTDIYFKDVSLSIGGKAVTLRYNGVFGIGGDYPVQEVSADYIMPDSLVTKNDVDEISGKQKAAYMYGNIFFNVQVNQNFADNVSIANQIQDVENFADVACVLRLPPTYTPTGTPTKLCMWAHGAGGKVTETSAGELEQATSYMLPAGYALFDVNGSNNNYTTYADHMGGPRVISAYIKAYQYIVDHYNVDPYIYVHGHSMGGLTALNFAQHNRGIVRCLALVHPVTDLKGQAWEHPWFGTTKQQIATEYNFDDKTGATFEDDKLVGYDPITTNAFDLDDAHKIINPVPIKIWHGNADTTVSLAGSQVYVDAVKATGGDATLRTVDGIPHKITPAMLSEIVMWLNRH